MAGCDGGSVNDSKEIVRYKFIVALDLTLALPANGEKKFPRLTLVSSLHKIFNVWDDMMLSANCILIPWHKSEMLRLFDSTVIEMFDVVTQPPSLLGICAETLVRRWRPSIVQRISAAGFDGAVEHWKLTTSPWRASFGPLIVTWLGESAEEFSMKEEIFSH